MILTWIVTRFVIMSQTISGDVPGDVTLYAKWAGQLAQGAFPQADVEFQYPPAASLVFLAVGTSPDGYYRRFTLLMLAFDLIIMLALILAAQRNGSSIGAWVWAGSAIILGPLLVQRFDLVPTAFAVVSVLLIARASAASGAFAGLGALVKVWPGLALLGVPRRHLPRALIAAALSALVGWLVIAVFMSGSTEFLRAQRLRGLEIESTFALPLMVLRAAGFDIVVRGQFGSWEITHASAGWLSLASTVVTVAAIGALAAFRLLGRLERTPAGDVVLFAVLLFVTLNKVNSPQFTMWLLGMTAAALADPRSRMLGVTLLVAMSSLVANQALWPQFEAYTTANTVTVGLQAVRVSLLVAATAWAGWLVLRRED